MTYRRTFVVEFEDDTPMPSDVLVTAALRGKIVRHAPNDMVAVMDALVCAVEQEVADQDLCSRVFEQIWEICAVHAEPMRALDEQRHHLR